MLRIVAIIGSLATIVALAFQRRNSRSETGETMEKPVVDEGCETLRRTPLGASLIDDAIM